MCGIAGWFGGAEAGGTLHELKVMLDTLEHRGPDDEGYAALLLDATRMCEFRGERTIAALKSTHTNIERSRNAPCRVALGHTRLSIIDLSEYGHQPMSNEDGTIWVTYNGEIYNYPELIQELTQKGHIFRSRTDTEVIVHAYEEWGETCLQRFNGMFAFSLWDSVTDTLFCARDRFGIKPFYYTHKQGVVHFASEIKALLATNDTLRQPDTDAVIMYLAYSRKDHSEKTFFKDVRQLPPASYFVVTAGRLTIKRYWDLPRTLTKNMTLEDASSRFKELFTQAVTRHMRSDVPVGFCLSGGLDSSSIVGVAHALQEQNPNQYRQPFNTFTACYDQLEFDERTHLNAVLEGKSLQSHLVFPKPDEFMDELDNFLWHQEEPFGRFSAFSQYRVMQLAHEHSTKVLLDGQGGDELLAGYHAYWVPYLQDLLLAGRVVFFFKELQRIVTLIGADRNTLLRSVMGGVLPQALLQPFRKRQDLHTVFPWIKKSFAINRVPFETFTTGDKVQEWSYNDLLIKQLQKLLHFEDRNSMAFSIESRVPFLDTALVEAIFTMPGSLKIGAGWPKRVLRKGMKDFIPRSVAERRDKMGFVTPGEDIWMRKDLKPWCDSIIASESFRNRPYWSYRTVKDMYKQYQAGDNKWNLPIMNMLTVELWSRKFIDQTSAVGEGI